MNARGVGGFDLEIIYVLNGNRVAQQFIAAAPDVAAEKVAEFPPTFLHVQNHLRRTEDVSGVAKGDGHAGHRLKRFFIIVRDELLHAFLGVRRGVKRLDRRLMFSRADFGNEHGVLLLNVRRVQQHDAAQIFCSGRAMDRAVVSFAQARQLARVIQMRMAQDDGVHLLRVERQNFIERLRFLAMALEQTAFEQKFFAVDLDEIHGAGGRARRAEEVDFHWQRKPYACHAVNCGFDKAPPARRRWPATGRPKRQEQS